MSITVQVRQGNLEQAMRVLKKKVQREGIIKDFRAKSVYEKPSAKKRRKKKEGIANFKKKQKKLIKPSLQSLEIVLMPSFLLHHLRMKLFLKL